MACRREAAGGRVPRARRAPHPHLLGRRPFLPRHVARGADSSKTRDDTPTLERLALPLVDRACVATLSSLKLMRVSLIYIYAQLQRGGRRAAPPARMGSTPAPRRAGAGVGRPRGRAHCVPRTRAGVHVAPRARRGSRMVARVAASGVHQLAPLCPQCGTKLCRLCAQCQCPVASVRSEITEIHICRVVYPIPTLYLNLKYK